MEEIINVLHLKKMYGNTIGVSDATFTVNKGEIFGFIGPNGAGKSSTIRCIMGLLNYQGGSIKIFGKESSPLDYENKRKIGYLPGEVKLYDDLTIKKMIEYNASFYNYDTLTKANILCERLNVDTSKKISVLSLGNLKKVGIVISLMHNPDLIIMDEATSGLDPLMQEEFYRILLEEKKNGKTIFFSSHNLAEVKKICDRVAFIKNGKIIKVDDIKNIDNRTVHHVKLTTKDEIKMNRSYTKNNNTYDFLYSGEINELLKELTTYNIVNLLIEEPSLEDEFMQYYEEKEEK